MISQLKNFSQLERNSPEIRRVEQLAGLAPLSAAGQWFARERAWINEQHLRISRIAAPTFFEQERAEWLRAQLESFGWSARLDRAGNVIAGTSDNGQQRPFVVSAHLDTVFAPARPDEVYMGSDGRFHGPGVSDNSCGLTALIAIGRLLQEVPQFNSLAESVLLVANVGEEGEGNLSGMRYLCRSLAEISAIKAFLVLDGPSTDHITAQALASRRSEVIFTGPGGHSWNDSGSPNPVHAIASAIFYFSEEVRRLDQGRARHSYNFGVLEGGTSINSIPSVARAKLDLRSEDPIILDELSEVLSEAVEQSLERENRRSRSGRLAAKIKDLGSRPGGKLPADSPLLTIIRAVDHHLHVRSRLDCASTDANVPLSLGLPAVSIGAGGQGGGAHTRDEWYQADGRELGLRRILLILAALSESHSQVL